MNIRAKPAHAPGVPCCMRGGPTPLQKIQRLRELRVLPPKPLGVAEQVEKLVREVKSDQKKLVRVDAALEQQWGGVVPSALRPRVQPRSFSRGTLTVRCADASTKYELERWLAGPGLMLLRDRVPAIKKVKCAL
jgi:hypothetical protein